MYKETEGSKAHVHDKDRGYLVFIPVPQPELPELHRTRLHSPSTLAFWQPCESVRQWPSFSLELAFR